jgi:hypothetical protein
MGQHSAGPRYRFDRRRRLIAAYASALRGSVSDRIFRSGFHRPPTREAAAQRPRRLAKRLAPPRTCGARMQSCRRLRPRDPDRGIAAAPSRDAARSHSRSGSRGDVGAGPVRLLATRKHRVVARLRLVAEAVTGRPTDRTKAITFGSPQRAGFGRTESHARPARWLGKGFANWRHRPGLGRSRTGPARPGHHRELITV